MISTPFCISLTDYSNSAGDIVCNIMEFITTVWYKSWTGDKGHSLLHTQEDHNPHKLIHTSR